MSVSGQPHKCVLTIQVCDVDIPCLLGRDLLARMGATLDLSTLILRVHDLPIQMLELEGHLYIRLSPALSEPVLSGENGSDEGRPQQHHGRLEAHSCHGERRRSRSIGGIFLPGSQCSDFHSSAASSQLREDHSGMGPLQGPTAGCDEHVVPHLGLAACEERQFRAVPSLRNVGFPEARLDQQPLDRPCQRKGDDRHSQPLYHADVPESVDSNASNQNSSKVRRRRRPRVRRGRGRCSDGSRPSSRGLDCPDDRVRRLPQGLRSSSDGSPAKRANHEDGADSRGDLAASPTVSLTESSVEDCNLQAPLAMCDDAASTTTLD